jgi:hypothetical protein
MKYVDLGGGVIYVTTAVSTKNIENIKITRN